MKTFVTPSARPNKPRRKNRPQVSSVPFMIPDSLAQIMKVAHLQISPKPPVRGPALRLDPCTQSHFPIRAL